jgi:hypothetical protein
MLIASNTGVCGTVRMEVINMVCDSVWSAR